MVLGDERIALALRRAGRDVSALVALLQLGPQRLGIAGLRESGYHEAAADLATKALQRVTATPVATSEPTASRR